MIPKTIDDLPHFTVSSIDGGDVHPGTGYVGLRLAGHIDRPSFVRDGRCWLLLPGQNCLIGDIASLDADSGAATFLTFDELPPKLVGRSLPLVDGYWQAYHVWMVTDPSWHWKKAMLRTRDVEAEIFQAEQSQNFDGREVRTWIRVKKFSGGKERLYPVLTGNPQNELEKLLASGWDHEHCELWGISMGIGDEGFNDSCGHWVCCACHTKYVATHDLSFVLN